MFSYKKELYEIRFVSLYNTLVMPKRLNEREIFQKGRFLLRDIDLELDNGSKVTYQIWDKPDTAMIVPVTKEGDVIFVTEYHAAVDSLMLSLPKGRIEPNEDPTEIANKELQEEIGYKAESIEKIATLTSIPGYISTRTHVFLARDLVESYLEGDEEWDMPISMHPLKNFEALIDNKKLTEARIIASLYEAKRFLSR